jgi:hypothetical protein
MIVGIQGGLGSGKTLLMTRYLVKDFWSGRNVHANFGLKQVDFTPLNMDDMLNKSVDLQDVSIGIDEFTVFADCRTSMSNKMITYFILQTRKRNVCLYYTTQDFGMLDKRILRHTHLFITADKIGDDDFRRYTVIDARDRIARPTEFLLRITPWFDYFDTNEIIEPLGLHKDEL